MEKEYLGFCRDSFLSYILKIVMTLFDRRVLVTDLTSSAFYFAIDTAMLLFLSVLLSEESKIRKRHQ